MTDIVGTQGRVSGTVFRDNKGVADPKKATNTGRGGRGGNTGGTTITEYKIAQAYFSTCSKSGTSLVFNWTLTTTGKTPNGLYTYTSPSSIVVSVQTDDGYYDLETLVGSARKYTFSNFESWAMGTNADSRVYFRVKCVSNYNETISYSVYRISTDTFTPNYP